MAVPIRCQMQVEEGDEAAQSLSSHEPLVILSARVMVGAVQPGTGHDREEPVEEGFVASVHTHGDGRLASVSPEAALTDEDPEKEPELERGEAANGLILVQGHLRSCYTVW